VSNTDIICSEPSSIVQVQAFGEDCLIAADAIREILAAHAVARIRGARIQGPLDLDAIAQRAGGLHLAGCKLEAPLTLRDAALGWLVLEECVLPGLWAERAEIGTLSLTDSLISGRYPGGTVRLDGARVAGDLRLDGLRVDNSEGPAVRAVGLVTGGGVSMRAVDARGTGPDGVACLTGAAVTGDLTLRGARLMAGSGPAFGARDMTVGGAAQLDQGFAATGTGEPGAVCLSGARVAGELSLRGASLANRTGPALAADQITVAGSVSMNGSGADGARFSASGTGERGAIHLADAQITGRLSLSNAILTNGSGPALVADQATVRGDALLDGGFTATGGGQQAAVSLARTTIGRGLTCSGQAASAKPGAPGLDLGQATVGSLVLSDSFASVPDGGMPLNVDGLTYTEPPVLLAGNPPVRVPPERQAREWISCLRHRAAYSAGAYRALAAAFQRRGDHDAARRILAAQRDDARARGQHGGHAIADRALRLRAGRPPERRRASRELPASAGS
jgi:hypothetical protein